MTILNADILKALIQHHIALIKRFNSGDFEEFSLLFLKVDHLQKTENKKSIQIIFRDSDVIFEYKKNYIILLPKTRWNDATMLLEGLQLFVNQDIKDTIVTYPDDGKDADELLYNLKKLVKKVYKIDLTLGHL